MYLRIFLLPYKAIFLIFKFRLTRFIFLPFIMTILLSVISSLGIYYLHKIIILQYLEPLLTKFSYLISLLQIIIFIYSLFFFIVFYRIIAQIAILPFLEPLQKKLYDIYQIKEPTHTTLYIDFINLIHGILKSFLFLFLYILVFLITFVLGPIQAIILFFFDSYAIGHAIFDVFYERFYPKPKQRSTFLKTKKKEIFFLGLSTTSILLIPVLGIFLSGICGYIAIFLYHYSK